ncbi:MAG TPA: SIMPL domain-containing protein [Bacteroidales bacterium]|nr:SIMPL domain-containing protein [Bacteroidales bacterium]
MEQKKTWIIAVALFAGLALAALILGRSLERFRNEDRSVSVKGFSEREVKADFAVWTIKARVASNDLAGGSKAIEENKDKVIEFLLRNGIKPNEIIQKDLLVTDKKAQEYGGPTGDSFRYVIDKVIQVRSDSVDRVQRVSRMTDELLRAGVPLSSNPYDGTVKFIFTKLNEIKPEMMTEATQNAREAAARFAKESNTRLGGLRKATQGLFTIVDRDDFLAGQTEGGFGGNNSDLYKKVRVVVSVEYSIN